MGAPVPGARVPRTPSEDPPLLQNRSSSGRRGCSEVASLKLLPRNAPHRMPLKGTQRVGELQPRARHATDVRPGFWPLLGTRSMKCTTQ